MKRWIGLHALLLAAACLVCPGCGDDEEEDATGTTTTVLADATGNTDTQADAADQDAAADPDAADDGAQDGAQSDLLPPLTGLKYSVNTIPGRGIYMTVSCTPREEIWIYSYLITYPDGWETGGEGPSTVTYQVPAEPPAGTRIGLMGGTRRVQNHIDWTDWTWLTI